MPKLKPPLHLLLLLLHLLLLPHPSRSALNRPDYHAFLLNATHLPSSADYDYIVVGGGTAGCPLAATLSHNFKVLLLERGGRYRDHPNLLTQEGFLLTLLEGDAGDSPAQPFTSEDGVTSARGRVLGGSSSINAGFYSRGDGAFFAATAAAGWDMAAVNRSYQWVERAVVSRPQIRRWQSAVRDALLDAGVAPFNGYTLDHVAGTKIGGTLFDRSGRRRTAADLLGYAAAGNIEVVLHAVVDRVLFAAAANSGSKQGKAAPAAIGVVYRDRAGKHHRATVRDGGEVILSAGAIGTPQLLLLSGVGPRSYLSSLGIPVTSNSPNVGRYLYDNPRNGISLVSPIPLDASLIQVVGITDAGAYFEAASNVLPFFPPSSLGLLRDPASPIYLTVVTLMEKVVGPGSHGSLRLATIDARDNPIVRFNYFLDPVDLAHCVRGVRKLGEVLRGRAMAGFRFPSVGGWEFRYVGPALPDEGADNGTVAEYCRRTVTTIWHYHGGCVLGKVVGGDLRVHGVAGLRVVDGSVFPVSPGTNPQATVMMLGRYMGLKITQERLQAAGS